MNAFLLYLTTLLAVAFTEGEQRESGNRVQSQMTNPTDELSKAIIRLQAGVLAIICALIGGGGLFMMTAWLLIKGGRRVGDHLQLLGQYFIGYSVTWTGSIVGFFYGALVGGAIGWTIGMIYNKLIDLRAH